MNREIMEKAEKKIIKKAAEIAFKHSNDLDDSQIQSILFRLCKDYIILGARLMEEELMKLNAYETKE